MPPEFPVFLALLDVGPLVIFGFLHQLELQKAGHLQDLAGARAVDLATGDITGYAHVIYNLMTGAMAFALLTPLGWIVESDAVQARGFDPQLALVAFHSAFNFIGVVAIIGFTQQFATLMVRLVPERGHRLTERLDHRLLSDRGAATDAMVATIDEISGALFDVLNVACGGHAGDARSMARLVRFGARTGVRIGAMLAAASSWMTIQTVCQTRMRPACTASVSKWRTDRQP